jgi:hypothetical protein
MPAYKGTLLFNSTVGTPTTGFSEAFDFTASSDAQAITEVGQWPSRRKAILSNSFSIVGFRLASYSTSVVAGKCKKKLKSIQIDACQPTVVGLLSSQNSPYDGALVRMFRQDKGKAREWELRGIPDTWIVSGALSIPVLEAGALLTWFQQMGTGGAFGNFTFDKTNCSGANVTPFTTMCPQRLMSRRVGRPFGLLRGRR